MFGLDASTVMQRFPLYPALGRYDLIGGGDRNRTDEQRFCSLNEPVSKCSRWFAYVLFCRHLDRLTVY